VEKKGLRCAEGAVVVFLDVLDHRVVRIKLIPRERVWQKAIMS